MKRRLAWHFQACALADPVLGFTPIVNPLLGGPPTGSGAEVFFSDVNNSGRVVGTAAMEEPVPAYWDPGLGAAELLSMQSVALGGQRDRRERPGSNRSRRSARRTANAINNGGWILADNRYLLRPVPEPPTIAMVVLGLLVLCGRRRRNAA